MRFSFSHRNLPFFIFILIFSVYSVNCLKSQESLPKHGLYLEYLGKGLMYSISYEHFLNNDNKPWLSFGIGFSRFNLKDFYAYTDFPIYSSLLFGKKHYFESGMILLPIIYQQDSPTKWTYNSHGNLSPGIFSLHFFPFIGYRYQPLWGGFNFKANLYICTYGSIFSKDTETIYQKADDFSLLIITNDISFWPAISFGWTFKRKVTSSDKTPSSAL